MMKYNIKIKEIFSPNNDIGAVYQNMDALLFWGSIFPDIPLVLDDVDECSHIVWNKNQEGWSKRRIRKIAGRFVPGQEPKVASLFGPFLPFPPADTLQIFSKKLKNNWLENFMKQAITLDYCSQEIIALHEPSDIFLDGMEKWFDWFLNTKIVRGKETVIKRFKQLIEGFTFGVTLSQALRDMISNFCRTSVKSLYEIAMEKQGCIDLSFSHRGLKIAIDLQNGGMDSQKLPFWLIDSHTKKRQQFYKYEKNTIVVPKIFLLQRLLKYNIVYLIESMNIPSMLARDWAKKQKGLCCEDPMYIRMNVFDMQGCNEIALKVNGPLAILFPNSVTPEILSKLTNDFNNNQLDLNVFHLTDNQRINISSQFKAWREFTSIIPPFHLLWLMGGKKWIDNLRCQKKQYFRRNVYVYYE